MVKHARKKQKLTQEHGEDVALNDANKDDEERMLESILFGTKFSGKAVGLEDKENDIVGDGGKEFGNLLDQDLFFVDDGELPQSDEQHASSSSSSSSASESESDSGSSSSSSVPKKESLKKTARKHKASAWVDPSDPTTISLSSKRLRKLRDAPHEEELQGREYESRLRRQFERINPEPEWAAQARNKIEKKVAWADDADEDGASGAGEGPDVQHLLSSSSGVLRSKKSKRALQAGTIDITRLRDANQEAQQAACGEIKSLAFHPSPMVPVLAVGSKDRRVRLYNIDGHLSPLLQTVHIPSLPLTSQSSVQFHPGGTQILLTGSRPFFYVYDLQSGALSGGAGRKRGRNQNQNGSGSGSGSMDISSFSPTGELLGVAGRGGYVHLVDWKASGTSGVKGLWWVPPSVLPSEEGGDARTHLAVLTGDSEIYIWDVAERRCVRKWRDEGGFRGAARVLAGSAAPSRGLLGIGSTSGLVNMYESSACASLEVQKQPKPVKTLENLTTPISSMRFNPDGQLLAVASREKKDALKLFHTPSLTTYANWPTSGTPLGHVTSIDFSAGSEYMAIGNSKGRVLLFSLKDYVV
ncbi:cgi-48 family protein [Moniliophthora roreri MCA 2997]|uniref:Cgi-48 family protein n=1 Tax=Moniliophthora roreri (strain MCA 2997) TaxID=1381753 RepID=V2XVS6_MONRO|nr:cgi-48 family protein [Moniliophthora roreri MCA 2997]